MRSRSDPAQGHLPTLIASFLHFDLSFMLWVLLGALGNFIADHHGLSPSLKGLLVAVPILTGSLLRVPLGIAADRFGGRRIGSAMLVCLYVPLAVGWLAGGSPVALFVVGALLGVAGASFAVALPLASRWYPAHRQGLVMGIAAAGNSGTVTANLLAPILAGAVGWQSVLGLALAPLTLVLVGFRLLARESPDGVSSTLGGHLSALRQRDLWWFGLLYSVTFGGYVGLSSFAPIFLRDQYDVSAVTAGHLTAGLALAGSAVRPFGGYLADRVGGGVRPLAALLGAIAALYLLSSRLPDLPVMVALLTLAMLCMGAGNGAVFQLVPQRFQAQIGIATGLVGALGGIGGFVVPTMLGTLKHGTGSFADGFLILAVLAGAAFVTLAVLYRSDSTGWRISWRGDLAEEGEAA